MCALPRTYTHSPNETNERTNVFSCIEFSHFRYHIDAKSKWIDVKQREEKVKKKWNENELESMHKAQGTTEEPEFAFLPILNLFKLLAFVLLCDWRWRDGIIVFHLCHSPRPHLLAHTHNHNRVSALWSETCTVQDSTKRWSSLSIHHNVIPKA